MDNERVLYMDLPKDVRDINLILSCISNEEQTS